MGEYVVMPRGLRVAQFWLALRIKTVVSHALSVESDTYIVKSAPWVIDG